MLGFYFTQSWVSMLKKFSMKHPDQYVGDRDLFLVLGLLFDRI
jgi:hypothetical protein